MNETSKVNLFIESARKVGSEVVECANLEKAVEYIVTKSNGRTLVPDTVLTARYHLKDQLRGAGAEVFEGNFRQAGQIPAAGVTFSNFALADTGTIVLESTQENIRLATTLPERHFVLLDPVTILADNLEAARPMVRLHKSGEACIVAYITGPSRTADIERVLTIGCHGPREVHILLVEGISDNFMEN